MCLLRSYFVGGLHPEITREELQEYLSGYAPVEEIDIKMDVSTGELGFRDPRTAAASPCHSSGLGACFIGPSDLVLGGMCTYNKCGAAVESLLLIVEG